MPLGFNPRRAEFAPPRAHRQFSYFFRRKVFMFFKLSNWVRPFFSRFGSHALPRSKSRRLSGLELLEDRTVPAMVAIDPGAYTGYYDLYGVGSFAGSASVDLTEGSYSLSPGGADLFNFSV